MTNEEKARELANLCNECELVDCGKGIVPCINLVIYKNTLDVAEWKDEQFKELLNGLPKPIKELIKNYI